MNEQDNSRSRIKKYESDLAHVAEEAAVCFVLPRHWHKGPTLFPVSWRPHVVAHTANTTNHTANTTKDVSLVACYRSFLPTAPWMQALEISSKSSHQKVF